MKNLYFVIDHDDIIDAQKYLDSQKASPRFRVFIEREMGIGCVKGVSGKPDYIKLANRHGFDWEPNADVGFLQYDYKANLMLELMKLYSRLLVSEIGFPIYEVRGANVYDRSHPVVEAYAKLYGSRLFNFKSGNKQVVMSYDASYPQFNLAGKYQLSYKDLPFAHFSYSDCYRHEQSGECMLLYRDRRFFMPDLHPYFKDIDEAFEWYPEIEKKIVNAAEDDGCSYEIIAEVASPIFWKQYQKEIIKAVNQKRSPYLVKVWNDEKPRYWVINVDYKIVDQLSQSREIACIQIDVGNAERLGVNYLDNGNKRHFPVIIHVAVPGGIERYLYMLFDNYNDYGGLPCWIQPIQLRLLPISDKFVNFAVEIASKIRESHIRVDIDDRNESIGRKLRRAKEECIPESMVIGEKEANGEGNMHALHQLVGKINRNCAGKPFLDYIWPEKVSRQVR